MKKAFIKFLYYSTKLILLIVKGFNMILLLILILLGAVKVITHI